MRCLFFAKNTDLLWLKEYFPALDPYLLKLVNKPLLEYSLDLLSLMNITELRIVSDGSVKSLEEYFQDGAKWGVKISYALTKPDDTLDDVYLKNYSFCKEQDMLLWDGYFFISFNRLEFGEEINFKESVVWGNGSNRLIYLKKGDSLSNLNHNPPERPYNLFIRDIKNIPDYYQLSMEILNDKYQSYVLPGYSNDKFTHLGVNIVYPNSSELNPPIMIGNGCRFQRYTIIGPNSIIGDNVLVDENSIIKDSIIYDNTYIGSELDFNQKIVNGNLLFSGITGEIIQITDKILVSSMEKSLVISLFNRFTQVFFSLIFIIIQFIPWCIFFFPYSALRKHGRNYFLINKDLKLELFVDQGLLSETWYGRLLLRFSLDKFSRFWSVITGKLLLVGNSFYTNSSQHRKLVKDLPVYSPGAFSLAEIMKIDTTEVNYYYEVEYIEHNSVTSNCKIVIKSLISRLLNPTLNIVGKFRKP